MEIVRLATLSGDFKMIDTLNSVPHKHIIDTVTSYETKIILDTLRLPSNQSLDLISKVDTFYNNAWIKLSLTVTIFFILTGVIVPLIIQHYQKKVLKLEEEKLKAEILSSEARTKKLLDKHAVKIKKEIKDSYDAQIHLMSQKIEAIISKSDEKIAEKIIETTTLLDQKYDATIKTKIDVIISYLRIIPVFVDQRDFQKSISMLKELIPLLSSSNVHLLDLVLKNEQTNFEQLIGKISSMTNSEEVKSSAKNVLGFYKEFHSPGTYGLNDLGGYPNKLTF